MTLDTRRVMEPENADFEAALAWAEEHTDYIAANLRVLKTLLVDDKKDHMAVIALVLMAHQCFQEGQESMTNREWED